MAYYREQHLPVTIVRLFNTTGPRQTGHYGMVLPTFARQALNQEPITVYGTGEQSRCFAHVYDVLDALVACVSSDRTVGEIFNVGSTGEITINQLAERVIARSVVHSYPFPAQLFVVPGEARRQARSPRNHRVKHSKSPSEALGTPPGLLDV